MTPDSEIKPPRESDLEAAWVESILAVGRSKWTKSATQKVLRSLIGPFGACWTLDTGRKAVGWYTRGARVPVGVGDTWEEAIRRGFLKGEGTQKPTQRDPVSSEAGPK